MGAGARSRLPTAAGRRVNLFGRRYEELQVCRDVPGLVLKHDLHGDDHTGAGPLLSVIAHVLASVTPAQIAAVTPCRMTTRLLMYRWRDARNARAFRSGC
jgi:hypothetical protein